MLGDRGPSLVSVKALGLAVRGGGPQGFHIEAYGCDSFNEGRPYPLIWGSASPLFSFALVAVGSSGATSGTGAQAGGEGLGWGPGHGFWVCWGWIWPQLWGTGGGGGGVPTPSPPHPRVPQPCPSPTFKRPHPHPGVRPPNGQVSAQTGRYPSTPHGNARTNSRAGSCLRGGASPWQRVKPFGAAT